MDSLPIHVAVLPAEIVQWLNPQPGQILVDGTLGAGGHTRLLAERLQGAGYVLAVDRDPAAVAAAEQNLRGLNVKVAAASYLELSELLAELDVKSVNGIVLDLGLSSDQLADENRGFSFHSTGPLDLRFNPEEGEPAYRLLARLRENELADIIYQFGEERLSRRIARQIVAARLEHPVQTAEQLATLVRRCVPRSKDGIDPATRTFQALRIAVNEELKAIQIALQKLPALLAPGGRLAVISFHSLEDRLVKEAFRSDTRLNVLTKKPLTASPAELAANPRSRSAKLRVAERIAAS
ncbi:Ribosomal RNA small subunit methyltransferase H [Anatilimnocola aggregata]|uniref:Ribosomal RNA small subunit methyltransferase H n=1 Tax=Anatilimnocola aggregata TaxID=2528021 RepID=A0A517YDL2_9BACT|nr:16S rRNA (cytosine(1402)-N(4))-methyltransferase RsmH [Anatilimnocola aggregata]QDU28318.1 Ribosomal RNA small subunit methyltransferase H [Anatilimnocola aggregata]